jgi:hypothetical protein
VVERAKPSARAAEAAEREALLRRRDAADADFHGQILQNRAQALIRESMEMAELALSLTAEADATAAALGNARHEIEDVAAQIETHATLKLPNYIDECEKEIGTLARRIAQLREEVAWASSEIEKGRAQTDTWRRMVTVKQGHAARLLLQLTQQQEDAEAARQRSRTAAAEAELPLELAAGKFKEAMEAERAACAAEEEAKHAQREALETAKEAAEPTAERQRALREAAAAEAAAVQLETRAEVVVGQAQRRLYEAEVTAATAAAKAKEAGEAEAEMATARETQAAEGEAAAALQAQRKEHRPVEVPAI